MEDSERTFYEELGGRLKEARNAANLTQSQFASRVALTRSSIANMEAGRQGVTAYQAAAFAGELGVDALWLLVGRQPADRPQPPRQPVKADALHRVVADLDGVSSYLKDVARQIERSSSVPPEGEKP